jgi:hypothetical protein
MPLLRPKAQRTPRRLPMHAQTVVRCPKNGHQVSWCRGLCEPVEGRGLCGRDAPHAMVGRTQLAIAAYNASQR